MRQRDEAYEVDRGLRRGQCARLDDAGQLWQIERKRSGWLRRERRRRRGGACMPSSTIPLACGLDAGAVDPSSPMLTDFNAGGDAGADAGDAGPVDWNNNSGKWGVPGNLTGSIFGYRGPNTTTTDWPTPMVMNGALVGAGTVAAADYTGMGMSFNQCVNAPTFTGVSFTVTGSLGGMQAGVPAPDARRASDGQQRSLQHLRGHLLLVPGDDPRRHPRPHDPDDRHGSLHRAREHGDAGHGTRFHGRDARLPVAAHVPGRRLHRGIGRDQRRGVHPCSLPRDRLEGGLSGGRLRCVLSFTP